MATTKSSARKAATKKARGAKATARRGSAKGGRVVPVRAVERQPFVSLQQEINRLFEDFRRDIERGFSGLPFISREVSFTGPRVDISETDSEIEFTAELPGMDAKDVEVLLTDGTLRIRGEKRSEREEKKKGYHLMERSFGSFERSFVLPTEVDPDKASASFRKGVLTVRVPKRPAGPQKEVKKIAVKASS